MEEKMREGKANLEEGKGKEEWEGKRWREGRRGGEGNRTPPVAKVWLYGPDYDRVIL